MGGVGHIDKEKIHKTECKKIWRKSPVFAKKSNPPFCVCVSQPFA